MPFSFFIVEKTMRKRQALITIVLFGAFISMFGYYLFCKKGVSNERLERLTVVAHRAGVGAMENSLAGIRECMAAGVSEIEIDVRMTADGELVLCHDDKVRAANGAMLYVCYATLSELQQQCAGAMPTLGEAFETVGGRCRLLLDAKCSCNAEQFAKALINEVALYQAAGWVSVQSLDDALLGHLHRLGHPFPLEKIIALKIPFLPIIVDNGLSLFNFEKYDYISSFNICYKALTPSLVNEIHSRGKAVKVWSPDAPHDIPALDVDGVITDYPRQWLPVGE